MADATITIGADAGQAEATLAELKALTSELFAGIGLDAKKSAAAQDALAAAWKEQKVTLLQANDAAAKMRPQIEGLSKASSSAAFNLKDLSKSLLGFGSAAAVIQKNVSDVEAELTPLVDRMKQYVIEATGGSDASRLFAAQMESFLRPTTIAKNLIEQFVILYNQLRIATGQATAESIKAEAEQARINAGLEKYNKGLVESAQALADRSVILGRVIEQQSAEGEVTKTVRDDLQKLLGEYAKAGTDVPPDLQAIADKLGVLSVEQEKAAESSGKAAGKLREEKAAVQESKSEFEGILGPLGKFTDEKTAQVAATDAHTKALQEETKALGEAATAAQKAAGDAQDKLQDAAKRRAELEGKSVLSVEEAEELLDLQTKTAQLQAEAANTAEDAAQKTFEYGEAQSELAGATTEATGALDSFAGSGDYVAQVNRELEQSSAQLGKALADMGGEAASANEIVETIGENGERKFSNVTEAAGEFGDVLVQVGEDGQYVMESIERGTEGVAQAAPAAADGIAQVGDELRNLPDDKDDTGLGKAKSDSEALANTLLPRILELCKEIRKEAGGITLGGGGAGI